MFELDKEPIKSYLKDILGLVPRFEQASKINTLPFALREGYSYVKINILEQWFLLLSPSDKRAEVSPARIKKQLQMLEARLQIRAVYTVEQLASYNRRHFIDMKIPFIIPSNQLYLPDLGIDLREHMKAIREKKKSLSPSAQYLLLATILKLPKIKVWTATVIGEVLGTTKMTMSRSIDELLAHDLIQVETVGREKHIQLTESPKTLFIKAQPLLKTPVQKRIYLKSSFLYQAGLLAGLTALAEQTMLADSGRKVLALSKKTWKAFEASQTLEIVPETIKDMADMEIEVWKYDPIPLRQGNTVDRLSLYLSLKEIEDERVESERDKLLGEFK